MTPNEQEEENNHIHERFSLQRGKEPPELELLENDDGVQRDKVLKVQEP